MLLFCLNTAKCFPKKHSYLYPGALHPLKHTWNPVISIVLDGEGIHMHQYWHGYLWLFMYVWIFYWLCNPAFGNRISHFSSVLLHYRRIIQAAILGDSFCKHHVYVNLFQQGCTSRSATHVCMSLDTLSFQRVPPPACSSRDSRNFCWNQKTLDLTWLWFQQEFSC